MELFRAESGSRIWRVHRIHVRFKYAYFSETCGSDTLVAMSYEDGSVRVHRLIGDRLEKLANIELAYNEMSSSPIGTTTSILTPLLSSK